VFAPIGLVSLLREQWPQCSKQAAQNRQAVRNRIQLAQLAGRIAAERAEQSIRPTRPAVAELAGVAAVPQPEPAPRLATEEPAESDVPALATVTELRPRSRPQSRRDGEPVTADDGDTSGLPISDYESLAAIHVVHRLPTLRPDELERVRTFERSHRARRTVLAKIEQLQESDT
jgi:hypothetical protein